VGAPAGTPGKASRVKPDVSNLRVFGHRQSCKMPRAAQKMAPTSQSIMMGFSRGWRLLQDSGQREDCDQQAGEVLRGDKSTGSRTMQNRWTQKQQMNWWLEAQVDAPAASGATDALGAGGEMDAPGVQAPAPVQGVEARGSAWSAAGRDGRACSGFLGAQWTRLLTGVGARSTAPAHGLEAHWVRLVIGLEAQWTTRCPAARRWTPAHGAGADGRACSWG
jgi:hypothetical protein